MSLHATYPSPAEKSAARGKRRLVLPLVLALVALLGVVALGGCGGGSDGAETPTAVTADDLEKDGAFWLSLTPDLKDDLVEAGKERLAEERPDGAAQIRRYATADLVAEIEKQYANESKRSQDIFGVYRQANDTLAMGGLNDALGGLDELCSGSDAPAECSQP
jgi:hypothetical protein